MINESSTSPGTLLDCVRTRAQRQPQADAVIDGDHRLSYAQLAASIDTCAATMIVSGILPGDRVATLAVPGREFLVTFLATAAIGGIWVGLNPRYTAPELDALIERMDPRLVFYMPTIEARSYRAWAAALPGTVRAIELGPVESPADARSYANFIAAGQSCTDEQRMARYRNTAPDDPCLIVFTSGSTGAPKGTLISQRALIGASQVQATIWVAQPMRLLVNLPINHIGCVGDLCCYALVSGGAIVFMPRFDPIASLDAIDRHAITVWGQVPTMFQLTLDAPGFDTVKLRSLQLLFWGGAHAAPELIDRLLLLAPMVATSYGQTETVGSITFTSPNADATTLEKTVGRAVPPYEIRIVDTDGISLPQQQEGEIEVRTPFGMCGYWRDPDESARMATADGWQRTGDVGMLGAQGDLTLLGRVNDVFKSGGYNLYPAEIEAALISYGKIQEASVVGVSDPIYGNVAVAFLVADAALSDDALRQFLRTRLANYKIPKRFHFVAELPRLPVGKVDKSALREQASRP